MENMNGKQEEYRKKSITQDTNVKHGNTGKYHNRPDDLQKYIKAQDMYFDGTGKTVYEKALEEIKAGNKEEHWIWYIWPQIEGLGKSFYCEKYGVPGLEGAIAYLENRTLHDRLMEISSALLELNTTDLLSVMWQVDCMKVRSSITLFYEAAIRMYGADSEEVKLFVNLRDKYFGRIGFCDRTLEILNDKQERLD